MFNTTNLFKENFMKSLISLVSIALVMSSTNSFAANNSGVSAELKKTICKQLSPHVPQVDGTGISNKKCLNDVDFEVLSSGFDLLTVKLADPNAGDGYQTECVVVYSSSRKSISKPKCEMFVP